MSATGTGPTLQPRVWLLSLVLLPVLIYLLLLARYPLTRAYEGLRFPYQLDAEEGFLVNQALQLSHGKSIYQPIEQPPYLVGTYAPIYPALNAIVLRLHRPSTYFLLSGRLISLLSWIVIVVLMFILVYEKTRNVFLSLLSPLLVTITYDLYEWLPYYRVDLLAICLCLIGLTLIALTATKLGKVLAICALVLAVFTKQSQLAAPISCCIFLLLQDYKVGLRFVGGLLAPIALIFILLNIVTGGEYYKHTVLYNANIFDFFQLKVMLKHLVRFNRALLVAAGIICLYGIGNVIASRLHSTQRLSTAQPDSEQNHAPLRIIALLKQLDLITIYFLVSLLSLIGLAKQGAATNYLLEPHIAISLFVCTRLGILMTGIASRAASPLRLAVVLLITALLYAHALNLHVKRHILFFPHNPDSSDMQKASAVLDAVRDQRGDVLSEFPIFNIMAGKPVLFHGFIMSQLAREGKWNQTPFLRTIHEQRFDLVITTQDITNPDQVFERYTPEILKTLRHFYEPYYPYNIALDFGRGTPYYLYVPRKKVE
jgi:hypothetical protein